MRGQLGLRKGELLGLRWADVDFGAGRLSVRQALQRVDGRLELVEPKTALSRRTVPVPSATMVALRARREQQEREEQAAVQSWAGSGLIFTTLTGRPLDPRNVNRSCYTLRDRAGLGVMVAQIGCTRALAADWLFELLR